MATGGTRPKPTKVHLRNGSYRKNPQQHDQNVPKPNYTRPVKPAPVKKGMTKRPMPKWNRLIKELDRMGVHGRTDYDLLELYCMTFSKYREALVAVNKIGVAIVGKNKAGETTVQRNQFEVVMSRSMDRLAKLGGELGLSPVARTRLSAAPDTEESDLLASFMAAGKRRNKN